MARHLSGVAPSARDNPSRSPLRRAQRRSQHRSAHRRRWNSNTRQTRARQGMRSRNCPEVSWSWPYNGSGVHPRTPEIIVAEREALQRRASAEDRVVARGRGTDGEARVAGVRRVQRPVMRDAERVSSQSHARAGAVGEQYRSPRPQDAGTDTKRRRWLRPPPSSGSQRSRDPGRRSTRP